MNTGQGNGVVDEVLELREDPSVHDTASLDWPVHIETGGNLTVFEEEEIAGEVLQSLNPGEVLDVFIQPVGVETAKDSGTEGVEVDSLPLRDREIVPPADIGVEVEIEFHEGPLRDTDAWRQYWCLR